MHCTKSTIKSVTTSSENNWELKFLFFFYFTMFLSDTFSDHRKIRISLHFFFFFTLNLDFLITFNRNVYGQDISLETSLMLYFLVNTVSIKMNQMYRDGLNVAYLPLPYYLNQTHTFFVVVVLPCFFLNQ